MTKNASPSRRARLTIMSRALGATLLAAGMALAPVGPAQAFTPDVREQADHYFHCLGLLLTDPVAHAKECSPNTIPNTNKSLAELGVGAPPPPPPSGPQCGEDEYEEGGECYPKEPVCEESGYSTFVESEYPGCPWD